LNHAREALRHLSIRARCDLEIRGFRRRARRLPNVPRLDAGSRINARGS